MTSSPSIFQKLFTDILPPPRYLVMPSVGLDISDEAIRFVDLQKKHSTFKLLRFGEERIPKGVIEEGYVRDAETLTNIMRKMKEKHNLHFVKASLPEEKSYLFKTQIPYVSDFADIRGAVRYKLEENVPVPLQDAVFDFRFIREPKAGDTTIDLSVAVIHSKVVASFLEIMASIGIVPIEFCPESQAIANVIIPRNDPDTYILIAVRETKTVLAIVSDNIIQFSSTLSVSGESLAASLVRDEIQKLFVYWDSRDEREEAIKAVLVCGSDALPGLNEHLARSLNVPVKVANVWTNIFTLDKYLPPLTYRQSLDYASALGLALPYD